MMPLYRVKISRNSVQKLQSWQGLFVNVRYDTDKNWRIYISGRTWPIFAIFSPYESALRADNGSVPHFQIFQGTLPWQPNNVRKCYQRRLISLAFLALVLENELQHDVLVVRINSGDDGATSSKNLVNFCLVTPEMTGRICERQVRHSKKLAYFVEYLRIYWKYFRNIFTIWNRFTCRWWICTLFSNLSRDVAIT